MDSLLNVSRRKLLQLGLAAPGMPIVANLFGARAFAQDASTEAGKKGAVGGRAEEELYPAKGLGGGGQLEIRLTQSVYTSDPDALYAEFLGKGVPMHRELADTPDGLRAFEITDNNGYVLCFVRPLNL